MYYIMFIHCTNTVHHSWIENFVTKKALAMFVNTFNPDAFSFNYITISNIY